MTHNETKDLRFSSAALANRPLFLSQLNDVNIFVEDVGKEYEYEEIFERLFNNEVSIHSIFPLGGKSAVLANHAENDRIDKDGKLNIYIVDGDFDNLWDDEKVESPNLIYLNRYNIESYFCSKEAVIGFARRHLKCCRKTVEEIIQYDEWRESTRCQLGQLFILFAVARRQCPTHPNVNLGAGNFLDGEGYVSVEKYNSYLNGLEDTIGPVSAFVDEMKEIISTTFHGEEKEKILSIICGKYQLESLCRRLRYRCKRGIKQSNLRSALISSFDIELLNFLKERILNLIAEDLVEKVST